MNTDLDTRIEDIDFTVKPWDKRMSTRVKNTLLRHGIMTLGELVQTDRDDLPAGISTVSKAIIDKTLRSMGLRLKSRRRGDA
jgi:DNA-directed RNA polymerase alpha subunit